MKELVKTGVEKALNGLLDEEKEGKARWTSFFQRLKGRGLFVVTLVVGDK